MSAISVSPVTHVADAAQLFASGMDRSLKSWRVGEIGAMTIFLLKIGRRQPRLSAGDKAITVGPSLNRPGEPTLSAHTVREP